MTSTTDRSRTFHPDELDVIRRFVGVLHDVGVQATLNMAVVRNVSEHEIAARCLGVALGDLGNVCESRLGVVSKPEDVVDAAVSLKLVVEAARQTGIFPDDFLPSDALVNYCLEHFYENARIRAAQYAGAPE